MPSLLDIIPPETQHLLGILSLIAAAVGLIFCISGIKIARFSVAIFLGLLGAAAGATQLPHDLSLSPVTAALLGFVVGVLTGAIAFKFLQATILAACIALAVAGIFYNMHAAASPSAAIVAAPETHPFRGVGANERTDQTDQNPIRAATLLIPNSDFSHAAATTSAGQSPFAALAPKLRARWNALAPADQKRLLLISLSSALAALLLALAFPRPATWLASAALGSLLLLTGLSTAAKIYTPEYQHFFPTSPLSFYLTLLLLTSIGLLLQYKCFWPPSTRPKPLPHLENPLYRGPAHPAQN